MPTIEPKARKAGRSKKSPIAPTPVRSGRRWIWLFAIIIMPLALVAAAPWLLTSSAVVNHLVGGCLPDLKGSVSVGSVSAGWFSPCSATEIVLADADGQTVIHIPSAGSDKTLLGMLLNLRDLGKVHVERPEVQLILHEGGSNLEDMFAIGLKTQKPGSPTLMAQQQGSSTGMEIEITDATVSIQDQSSGEKCLLTRLSLKAVNPSDTKDALDVELLALVNQAGTSGPLALSLHSTPLEQPQPALATTGELALRADFIPLAMAQSLICRVLPGTRLAGTAQTQWNIQWGLNQKGQPRRTLAGRTAVRGLVMGGGWLGGDALELAQLDLPCQIDCEAGHLEIQQSGATCDVGQLTCQASLVVPDDLAALATPAAAMAALRTGTVDVAGTVDLARLAQLLPKFLQIREDVQVRSGQVAWHVRNNHAGGATTWNAQVDASRLVAVCQGREVACEKPLHAVVDAQQDDHGLSIQNVQANADFLDLQGKGSADSFQMSGTCDLARLAAEAGKFVALDGVELIGQAACKLQAGRGADGAINATGNVQLNQFQLASAGSQPWTEEQLTLTATLAGRLDGGSVQELNQARLEIVSGDDHLGIALRQPVAKISPSTTYPLSIDLTGEAANWLKRAGPCTAALDGWQAEGQITAQAQAVASCSLDELNVESSQLDMKPFRLRGCGCNINDDECSIAAVGQVSARTGRIDVADFTLRCTSLGVRLTKGSLDMARPLASATGQITAGGDVARLQSWLADPNQQLTWQLSGQLNCQADLQPADGHTSAQLEATIQNLLATSQTGGSWREPVVQLTAKAAYDGSTDTLSAEQLDCTSSLVQLKAQGKITGVATQRLLDCQGQVKYDLEKLAVLLQPYVKVGDVKLSGQESRSFSLSGPLVPARAPTAPGTPETAPASEPAQLAGMLDFGWESASMFGFQFGPGVAKSEFAGGVLHVLPLDLPVNQGRIHLEAQAQLLGGPALATVPAGTVIDHVAVSQDLCNRGLMFVAPVLGHASRVEGQFSVAIDSCSVPLADPKTADIAGRVTIHSMQVDPGPLVQELHVLMGKPAAVKLQQESQVPFRMVQGRIYHQNMNLMFPEFTIRTYGSVGLDDQSLALMAELPVPPKWLANNPAAGSLASQTIQLPIGGTLSHPKIDPRALEQATAKFIGRAAENVLRNGVDQGLNKLFGR